MEITPYTNGIHSLAEGLRQLNSFMKEGNDSFKMKEVVIKIHHGFETLFKDILFQRNPIFLLEERMTIKQVLDCYQGFYEGKNAYLFDEAKTITPSDAIKRIKDLHLCSGISPKEFRQLTDSFDSFNSLRNQLQHFALRVNPDAVIRILGNLVPRAILLLKKCYEPNASAAHQERVNVVPHRPLPGMDHLFGRQRSVENDLNSIYSGATQVIGELESRYDVLLNEAIKKFQKAVFPGLSQSLKIVDHGNVGAPPYMPQIKLSGWLNEAFEPYRNSAGDRFWHEKGQLVAVYEASLSVGQPVIKEVVGGGVHREVVSEVTITCDSTISHSSALRNTGYI